MGAATGVPPERPLMPVAVAHGEGTRVAEQARLQRVQLTEAKEEGVRARDGGKMWRGVVLVSLG